MNDLMTVDPDGRIRAVFPYPQPPEPPDYSAEGLIDIVVEQEPVPLSRTTFMGMPIIIDPTLPDDTFAIIGKNGIYDYSPKYVDRHPHALLCHNIAPPATEILDTKLQPVDRGDGGGEK